MAFSLAVGIQVVAALAFTALLVGAVSAQFEWWKPTDPKTKGRLWKSIILPVLPFCAAFLVPPQEKDVADGNSDQIEVRPTARTDVPDVTKAGNPDVDNGQFAVGEEVVPNQNNPDSTSQPDDLHVWVRDILRRPIIDDGMFNLIPKCSIRQNGDRNQQECLNELRSTQFNLVQPAINSIVNYDQRLYSINDTLRYESDEISRERLNFIQSEMRDLHTNSAASTTGKLNKLVDLRERFVTAINNCHRGNCPFASP